MLKNNFQIKNQAMFKSLLLLGFACSKILLITSFDNGLVMKELTQAYFFE